MKKIFKKAQQEKRAIGQFNFSTFDQLKAISKASDGKPIILGTSEGESKFFGLKEAVALAQKSNLYLNLDHGKDLKYVKEAIKTGYNMVHFDGSDLGLKDNIKITKEVVKYAHKHGVLVESEIDPISKKLTDPQEALFFLNETKADCLAIAVGSVHGKEKAEIDFNRIKEIKKLTNAFLVLHGGSGLSFEDLKKAISLGIVKININTELRIIWKKSLEKTLKQKDIKPYNLLPYVQEQIEKKVREYLHNF